MFLKICLIFGIFQLIEGDQNCLKALVSSITTRLFNPDQVRDRHWDLSSHNTILALGHIAVILHSQGKEF